MARLASPRPRSRRDWAGRARQQVLRLSPALLDEARTNSQTLAGPGFLMQLAREIALSRGAELARAYKGLLMVQPGFRQSRSQAPHDPQLGPPPREACVVFVLRRKWRPDTARGDDDPRTLPRWLVCYAEHGGQRLPFALPTDVQEASDFSAVRVHGPGAVWLQPPGLAVAAVGAVCCALRFQAQGYAAQLCLLSAEHVFSPRLDVEALAPDEGLGVAPLDAAGRPRTQPVLARSMAVAGVLRPEEDPDEPSLDVQLAHIDDLAAARALLGGLRLNADEPWVRSADRLWELGQRRWFYLRVPDNHGSVVRGPLQARFEGLLAQPLAIDYPVRRGTQLAQVQIYHRELLRLQVCASPFADFGDSGCAVVVAQGDGTVTLAGLYIGGDGAAAFAIPAWQLFEPGAWRSMPPEASLEPVSL